MSWESKTFTINPADLQMMRIRNYLEKAGVDIKNITIEGNSIYSYPKIYIEGYVMDHSGSNKTIIHQINKVIFNPPATIILWDDKTKTVVKCGEHDEFDMEKGLVMAITKKLLGNKGNYYNVIKNLLKEAEYQYCEEYVYDPYAPRTVVKRIRYKQSAHSPTAVFPESYFECPACGDEILKSGARYCANCGQRLMWEEK